MKHQHHVAYTVCQTAEGKHLTVSGVGTEPNLLLLRAKIKAPRNFYFVCCHLLISSKSTLFPELRGNSLHHRAGDLRTDTCQSHPGGTERSHGLTPSRVHVHTRMHAHMHQFVPSTNVTFVIPTSLFELLGETE